MESKPEFSIENSKFGFSYLYITIKAAKCKAPKRGESGLAN